jgi:hypothetical protein
MKTTKLVGCVGIAVAAALFSTSSVTLSETPVTYGEKVIQQSGTQAHRVIHSLTSNVQYTAGAVSGNKWGAGAKVLGTASSETKSPDSSESRGGYKWGRASSFEQAGSRWGRASSFEQAGSRWGRASIFEQAGSRWGRASIFEQAGSRWGRASSFERQ